MTKLFKLLFASMCIISIASCGDTEKSRDTKDIKALAEKHVSEIKVQQLLQEYILSIDNDTNGVCYALVMPKQTLNRLMNGETYPTPGGLEKIQQSLVKRYVYGREYVDSCIQDKFDDKDWLINNTVNEPVNPIWEQIAHE